MTKHLTAPLHTDRLDLMGVRFADGDGEETPAPPEGQTTERDQQGQGQSSGERQEVQQQGEKNGENGFPEHTPVSEMTDAQAAAYWKHRSRSHEEKWKQVSHRNLTPEQVLDMQRQLDEANRERMSEQDRKVDDAKKTAADEARREVMPQLVLANITAAVARRNPAMSDDDIQARVEFLDLTKFLTKKGEVDADKVSSYATTLAPEKRDSDGGGEKKKFPDTGGGKRGPAHESAKARAAQVARERGWVRDDK